MATVNPTLAAGPGWLEPLLDSVARSRWTVATPVIDVLDDTTLEYKYQDKTLSVGGFDWTLEVPGPCLLLCARGFPSFPRVSTCTSFKTLGLREHSFIRNNARLEDTSQIHPHLKT